jgi:hypothetical protein
MFAATVLSSDPMSSVGRVGCSAGDDTVVEDVVVEGVEVVVVVVIVVVVVVVVTVMVVVVAVLEIFTVLSLTSSSSPGFPVVLIGMSVSNSNEAVLSVVSPLV